MAIGTVTLITDCIGQRSRNLVWNVQRGGGYKKKRTGSLKIINKINQENKRR
jgi:hypothetical protein